MNNQQIKIIKKKDKEESEQLKKKAECFLMSIYLQEMALKYPDSFKKMLEKLKVQLC